MDIGTPPSTSTIDAGASHTLNQRRNPKQNKGDMDHWRKTGDDFFFNRASLIDLMKCNLP